MNPESIHYFAVVVAANSRTHDYARAIAKYEALATVSIADLNEFLTAQNRYVEWLEGALARQLEATWLER